MCPRSLLPAALIALLVAPSLAAMRVIHFTCRDGVLVRRLSERACRIGEVGEPCGPVCDADDTCNGVCSFLLPTCPELPEIACPLQTLIVPVGEKKVVTFPPRRHGILARRGSKPAKLILRCRRPPPGIPCRVATTTTTTTTTTSTTTLATTTSTTLPPDTTPLPVGLHYAADGNFDSNGTYMLTPYAFNVADVSGVSALQALPAGVQGLVWVGMTETVNNVTYSCPGVDQAFLNLLTPFVGHAQNAFGFYLVDDPDPTGQYTNGVQCPQANLAAEADWIHQHIPGAKTFIVLMNTGSSNSPSFANTYNPTNSHIDLYGVAPYPCRTILNGCDYSIIIDAVNAAVASGVPLTTIVPVFQAFGLGTWTVWTDGYGSGQYAVPTATQEQQILATWKDLVPHPYFDYVYSWGSQASDVSLSSLPALQSVFLSHNTQP